MSTAATRTIQQQIDELRGMPVSRLRERYAEAFGEPTASGNRQWLFRRVAWRIQSLAEGDLSERARRRAAELARDVDVRVRPPVERDTSADGRAGARLVTITGRIASVGNGGSSSSATTAPAIRSSSAPWASRTASRQTCWSMAAPRR